MTTLINTASWIGLPSIAGWLKKVSVKLKAYKAEKDTIKELSQLTDYELNDIGISRGEIRNLARQHYDDLVNANLRGWI